MNGNIGNGNGGNGNNGGGNGGGSHGEAQRFAAEWRRNVMAQFDEQATINRDVARSLGDLTTAIAELKTVVADLKAQPDALRAFFGTYGGCIGQAVYVVIALSALTISILALVRH